MKSIKNNLTGFAILGGLVALAGFIQAQVTTMTDQSYSGSASLSGGEPDSVLRIAAEEVGLLQMSPDQIPLDRCGTWWIVNSSDEFPAPWPFLPTQYNLTNTPIYSLDGGVGAQFLVDGTTGTNGMSAADLDAVGNMVLDFIANLQETQMNAALHTMAVAMGLESDSEQMGYSFMLDTNSLWLEITNVANGLAYLNLHNGTDYVYEVWSKQDLTASNWDIETEVFPGTNQDVMPFTVSELYRTNLFIWARDWTGITSGGNETPEWWFWKYFGTVNLLDTNLDSQGNTLLYDYTNQLDPNVIWFSVSATNYYVGPSNSQVCLSITAGVPDYYAVLLDNATQAVWNPYISTNIFVDLGPTGGWHTAWIGLKGLPPDAKQTWQPVRLNLTWPPVLVLTNPVSNVVSVPIIQVYGYCQDILTSLSYDLSNATGLVTNQPAETIGKDYDTNGNATVYFECLDVPLVLGSNTITIHATDLVGDITTTNFNFTLDYSSKTNPPLVQFTWPQTGAQLSGSNFTLIGQVADPTVTIATQQVLTNGSGTNAIIYTNTYAGEIDRNGNFWLENLPLQPGTNAFAIVVADAVGNTSLTNLSVVQGSLVLTVNPVADSSQLWQPTVNVNGRISDSTYAVWVNGVKGTNYANGTWAASNVPPGGGGTATFTVTAYAPNEQQPDGTFGN